MNHIFLIGNGFDLAHGLETSYRDFIIWYLRKLQRKIFDQMQIGKSDDLKVLLYKWEELYEMPISKIEMPSDFKKLFIFGKIRSRFSPLLSRIIEKEGWADIEKEYFNCMLGIKKDPYKYYTLDNKDKIYDIDDLNNSLLEIKTNLVEYLTEITKNKSVVPQSQIIEIFKALSPKPVISIINFNYTNTLDIYKEAVAFDNVINIHGSINNPESIIFGYGDEIHEEFKTVEALDDNRYIENMKSVGYFNSHNLHKLYTLIESGAFKVHVFGHSLGVSDRLLLHDIFENINCKEILLHHFESDSGNNYKELVMNLSRHFFGEGKSKMRRIVTPFDPENCMSIKTTSGKCRNYEVPQRDSLLIGKL